MPARPRGTVLLAGRVVVAVVCLSAVLLVAGPAGIWRNLVVLTTGSVVVSLGLHAAIIAALAWRWRAIVATLGAPLAYTPALRLTFLSTLLNLVLPTSVGGDVGRVWLGRNQGVGVRPGAVAAVFDRGIGLLTLVALVALAVVIAPGRFPEQARWLPALAVLACCGLALALALGGRSAAIEALRAPLRDRRLVAATAGISLAAHAAAAAIAAVIAHGMGVELPVVTAVLLFPAVILATLVPVSIGGWGVRELAAIPLLDQAGVDAAAAAAIALCFGLTQLIAAGLGTAALSLVRQRARAT